MSKKPSCHVILVTGDSFEKTRSDLAQIAALLRPHGVRGHVVDRHVLSQLRLLPLWTKRCLSVAPTRAISRKLLPGRFLTGRDMSKTEELSRLGAANLPVPKWVEITPTTVLDPNEWGPYVVEKPSFGARGAMVRIRKTGRIRYEPTTIDRKWRFGKLGGAIIAQRFIYTGEWPTSYRVVTLFGEVVACYRLVTRGRGVPLRHRWDFRAHGGISIVSNTKTVEITLTADESIMALARRVYANAFPEIPVMHIDIVRDVDTGQDFVLECHPGRGLWPFSHPVYNLLEAEKKVDIEAQFGGLENAARIIARKTQELATRFPS